MRQERDRALGLRLITAVLCVILLVLPGVVIAETTGNATPTVTTGVVTSQPTTPVPTVSPSPENTTVAVTPPPVLILDTPLVENLTSTVNGSASPGSANVTIESIRWEWGDNGTPEFHGFPYSHMYSTAGTYTLSITAFQSDGQNVTKTAGITVEQPVVFPTTRTTPVPAGPPVLSFLEPVVEGMNVTLNGTLSPGSPDVTIASVRVDWNDGSVTGSSDLPVTHEYSGYGTYTLTITAFQSDGQNVTKTANITVEQPVIPETPSPTQNTSAPGGPGMPAGPPVLTLLEPVVDGLNVTLNGNLNPGSPGVTIVLVNVDWDDGNITDASDLPVTHRYSSPGTYTIAITGNQSDGQSTTKRIVLDLKEETPTPPGPATGSPPPGNNTPLFIVILVTAIVVVIVGIVAQRIVHGRRGPPPAAGAPKAASPRAGPMPKNLPLREELELICSGTDVDPAVLDSIIQVAVEIAREGREGQAVGTAFVVGDTTSVLDHSKQLILNPFQGHDETARQITDPGIRGHIKEFAQLDGAFVVTGTGMVEAAGRYITVDMSQVNLPGGMGSRHLSVASITRVTRSIGVVVSQSGGLISIFKGGKIVYTINW
jgi:PKD repeat protein